MGISSFQGNGPQSQNSYSVGSGTTSSDPFITVFFPRDPTFRDANYPVKKRWVNTILVKEWILENFTNQTSPNNPAGETIANWILLSSGGAISVETLTGDDGVVVAPNAANNINLLGNTVLNATHAKPLFTESPSLNTENIDIQLTTTSSSAAKNINNAGISSFDSNAFTVDSATGFVSLLGAGAAIEKIGVDAFTGPGTNPVVPNSGLITVTGGQVPAGTTANVIRTDSLAASTYTVEIQRSQAVAASTIGDNGVSHFNSQYFTVDANGFVSSTAPAVATTANLGITYAAGTFTVTSSSGAALSASNSASVVIPSRLSPGLSKIYQITANQSFTDSAGSNQIGNNLFGLTTAIAYAADLPFYIYAAADNTDANLTFFISRIPHRSICPVAANIAQSGNTLATTQGSFFSLKTITAANYAGNPCVCIGAFRMQYTGASWTVQALTDGSNSSGFNTTADGINCFHEGSKFAMTTGQFGAAAGSFFQNNGGTAPAWSTQSQSFEINKAGVVTVKMAAEVSAAGAGAVNATLALPFSCIDSAGVPGSFIYTNGLGNFSILNFNAVIMNAISSTPAFITVKNADLAVSIFVHNYIITANAS